MKDPLWAYDRDELIKVKQEHQEWIKKKDEELEAKEDKIWQLKWLLMHKDSPNYHTYLQRSDVARDVPEIAEAATQTAPCCSLVDYEAQIRHLKN